MQSQTVMGTEAKFVQHIRPLRTVEEFHACIDQCESQDDNGDAAFKSYLKINEPLLSHSSCHKHYLEYSSSSSPAISTTYSTLRNATIRTLSGEQLPRGHKSGPICFGDSSIGYTIAYVFRLVDPMARGHHRFYAFLALAGSDSERAVEACAIIWSFFERIAKSVVETAEHVAAKKTSALNSPSEVENITPISSFLAEPPGFDNDGFSRRGANNVRPNGIADLVGNPDFFCELHVTFVGMIRDLGKLLGGLRIIPIARHTCTDDENGVSGLPDFDDVKDNMDAIGGLPESSRSSAAIEGNAFRVDLQDSTTHCNASLVAHAMALAV